MKKTMNPMVERLLMASPSYRERTTMESVEMSLSVAGGLLAHQRAYATNTFVQEVVFGASEKEARVDTRSRLSFNDSTTIDVRASREHRKEILVKATYQRQHREEAFKHLSDLVSKVGEAAPSLSVDVTKGSPHKDLTAHLQEHTKNIPVHNTDTRTHAMTPSHR